MKKFKIACGVDDALGEFYPTMCGAYNIPEK